MTTICLVRHGQTDYNKNKIIQGRMNNLLNEKGINQAYQLANILKDNDPNWDIIISSPLSRAVKTADIIKEVLNNKSNIIKSNLVIERDFGEAEGKNITDELNELIYKDEVKGMEKTLELQLRCYEAIKEIAKTYQDKKILIVSHSHFIKGFFTYIDKNITFSSYFPNIGIAYVYFDKDKIIKTEFNKAF